LWPELEGLLEKPAGEGLGGERPQVSAEGSETKIASVQTMVRGICRYRQTFSQILVLRSYNMHGASLLMT
jgi:hypothetical protein